MHVNGTYLDVHGLNIEQAISVINKSISQSFENGTSLLRVNHGFNNGTKIKKWCLKEAIKNPLVIKVDNGENEGISLIYIKTKLF